jgi:hypothetical protein
MNLYTSFVSIVQESTSLTRISIVTGPGFETSFIQALVKSFQHRLGDEVQVEVEFVDSNPSEKSRKFCYISSNIFLNAMPKYANPHA